VDRRENWDAFTAFLDGSAWQESDMQKYRLDGDAYAMEEGSPRRLLFKADLDGEWHESPYPAAKADAAKPVWRNSWVEEPVRFKTELPGFRGQEGETMTIERSLISKSEMTVTMTVFNGDKVAVGPCMSHLRKTSPEGPAPIAWLRASGKSLATAEERQHALEQVFNMISENVAAISKAQGKDRVVPANFEGTAKMVMNASRYYQGLVPQWMTPEKLEDTCPAPLKGGVEADWCVINEPKGVGIVVVPWNAPVTLAVIPMLAMIASGNRVVIKPAELTPTVASECRRLFQKYLHGYVWVEEGGKEAVERLIDEGADHLVFTGGGEIAKVVAARCARMLTPVTLELGGKSPVFVDRGLSESMMDSVVQEILETKVAKTGQFCCAHDYALVHEEAYSTFCAKLKAALEALGPRRNIPLIGRRQYTDVKRKLEESKATCMPPMVAPYVPDDVAMTLPMTCLLDPALNSSVLTTEIFGPLLPIVKVKSVEEAISFVNDMPTGRALIAYCYTQDSASVDAFLAGTSSGNVAVNAGPQRFHLNFNAGFGGIGPSGSGVHMWGREALREFSNRKHVCRARDGFARSFFSAHSAPPPP